MSVASFLDDQNNIGLAEVEQSLQLLGNLSCSNELKLAHDMCSITYTSMLLFLLDYEMDISSVWS